MSARDALTKRFGDLGRGAVAALLLCGAIGMTLAMSGDLPTAAAKPPAVPTDAQGYVDSPARCDPRQSAVAAGRTSMSLIAICTDGRGHYEYRGMRLKDRAVLVLPAISMANGCFGVKGDTVTYTVSERKLLLTAGLRVLRDETMLEYTDFRTPSVEPVSNRTQSVG